MAARVTDLPSSEKDELVRSVAIAMADAAGVYWCDETATEFVRLAKMHLAAQKVLWTHGR